MSYFATKCPLVVWTLLVLASLGLALLGCGGEQISGSPTGGAGADGNRGAGGSSSEVLPGLGFVATSFGFYYPEDPETSVDGFDLDDRVSRMDSPGSAECAHDDFTGPNGEPGIDYNFLRIINNEDVREDGKYVFGGFRKGQLVDGVIGGAVKNGSMTILLQVMGLDDPENDDDVRVRIFGSEDSPALGTDNSLLPGATLSIHPDDHFHSGEAQGTIVDGVLVAGPIDLLFPVDIMIVQGEFLIHDSWLRIELGDGTFQGTVSGYWDVANIREIIGVPTTQNGNAANFTIEQFDAGMAEFADGDYDADAGVCTSFTIMYQFGGIQAFLVSGGQPGGTGGSGGSGGGGGVPQPYDQCVNDADAAALDALATEAQSGIAIVGGLTGGCTQNECGAYLGDAISGGEAGRNALRDCIAECISDQTGVSVACTSCYGSIAACSVGLCLAQCAPPNDGSQECIDCGLNNCIDVAACTGL